MYQLPKYNTKDVKNTVAKLLQDKVLQALVLILVIVIALSFAAGKLSWDMVKNQSQLLFQNVQQEPNIQVEPETYVSRVAYEQAVIDSVKSASPSVVSIIISKYLPVYETEFISPFPGFDFQIPQQVQRGTEKQQVGAGSGFIVSGDGLIVTNKHVVIDSKAEYTVLTNDGKKYSAKVLALDPVQDLAVIKIHPSTGSGQVVRFPAIALGNSDGIQIGQGAIAIGNALGEFRNTVSLGVISGLGRTISASGGKGFSETLENVIQTDAAINRGNSGGPLLNLKGEVIGVNVATAQGAQTIGFAIPINIAKKDIAQIIASNKIVYPFLGVRYELTDNGAVVSEVTTDSAAQKAGLKPKDVILEINGEKITLDNSMSTIIQKYNPGDSVTLKILRGSTEINLQVILGERSWFL